MSEPEVRFEYVAEFIEHDNPDLSWWGLGPKGLPHIHMGSCADCAEAMAGSLNRLNALEAENRALVQRVADAVEVLQYHRRIFEQFRHGANLDTAALIAGIDALTHDTGSEASDAGS